MANDPKKEKTISDDLAEISENLDKISDKISQCFKKAKNNPELIGKSIPQMLNQLLRSFSDIELAVCDVARRTKEAEDTIAIEKKGK